AVAARTSSIKTACRIVPLDRGGRGNTRKKASRSSVGKALLDWAPTLVTAREPDRPAALRLPARTSATSAVRVRGGWPAPQGCGRGPGREGSEGLRARAGRRSPRRGWRWTAAAPAPSLRRGAAPTPAAAAAHERPRRRGETPLGPPGWHDRATTPAPPRPAGRRPRRGSTSPARRPPGRLLDAPPARAPGTPSPA